MMEVHMLGVNILGIQMLGDTLVCHILGVNSIPIMKTNLEILHDGSPHVGSLHVESQYF